MFQIGAVMNSYFYNKVILVTGASSGIGAALARKLAAEGALLALAARRDARLQALAKSIGGGLVLRSDLTHESQARTMVRKTLKHYGRLDILINNAGVLINGGVATLPAREFERNMRVNYFRLLWAIQEALPALRKSKGSIVNVSSVIGKVAVPRLAAYCASKFAVEALSNALRIEERKNGVHVMTLRPDLTESEMSMGSKNKPIQTAIQVAQICLAGLRGKKAYVDCTFRGKLLIKFQEVFPNFTDFCMLKLEAWRGLH